MTLTLPPIPEPPFPVYGLDAGFRGSRSVDVWNRLGDGQTDPLWYVALAHNSAPADFVVVVTDGKLIAPRYTDAPTRQQTALHDVARLALLSVASTAETSGDEIHDVPSPADIDTLVEAVGEPPWQSANFSVDTRVTIFWTYHVGEYTVACADIGDVAIGLYGRQVEKLLSTTRLVPVNDSLGAYSLPGTLD